MHNQRHMEASRLNIPSRLTRLFEEGVESRRGEMREEKRSEGREETRRDPGAEPASSKENQESKRKPSQKG